MISLLDNEKFYCYGYRKYAHFTDTHVKITLNILIILQGKQVAKKIFFFIDAVIFEVMKLFYSLQVFHSFCV